MGGFFDYIRMRMGWWSANHQVSINTTIFQGAMFTSKVFSSRMIQGIDQ